MVVMRKMEKYAVEGLNGDSVLTASPDGRFLTIVSIATVKGRRFTTASLIIHLEGNRVIIEHDINNKPLVDALVQAGIPRDQIILAYTGEVVPQSA